MGWKTGWIVVFSLVSWACVVDDDSSSAPSSADDSCTGAACCDSGCPSSNPETGADDGDGTVSGTSEGEGEGEGDDECDGGACCDDDCGSDTAEGEADSGPGTGGGVPGTCRLTCDADADCCANGGECGLSCVAAVCVPTPCTPGSCGPVFQYDTECHELDGHAQCLPICNENCGQPNSGEGCFGVADDGFGYCLEPCSSPFIGGCAEGQTCDETSGRCVCTADSQCQEGQVCDPS